jgi:addiction module HigA family antidote
MPMYDPPHPGESAKHDCLEPLGLSVERAAQGMGVTPEELSDVVNEKVGISAEMAIRLAKAFGSTPETWLRRQSSYDLWQAKQRLKHVDVKQFWPTGPIPEEHVPFAAPKRQPPLS